MKTKSPLVSIITAVHNGAATIKRTIQNVVEQTYSSVEHIVIDGGSKDGTIDILKDNSSSFSYWISEPDRGIADAWNKGIRQAKGSIIGLLNSGDMYYPDTIMQVVKSGALADNKNISYGATEFIDIEGNRIGFNRKEFKPRYICKNFGFVHTTCFVPKEIYSQVGLFDTSYRIGADVEWLIRAYRHGCSFVHLDTITRMLIGGISEECRNEGLLEYKKALYKHGFGSWEIESRYVENRIKIFIEGMLRKGMLLSKI
jgi:glycosyltransferase involved in cell wall biosynthesis